MTNVSDLQNVRATCALAVPTLAYLLFKFDIAYGDCKTGVAKYDGKNYKIELNEVFWNSLNLAEKSFLLLHEVMHIFLFHHLRMKEKRYDRKLWNLATDYFINYTLLGYGIVDGKSFDDSRMRSYLKLPTGGLFERNFIGMSADEIYEKIKEDAPFTVVEEFDDIGECSEDELDKTQLQVDVASALVCGNSMKNIGNAEAGILRLFGDMIKPKINWKDYLKTIVDRECFQRYTYNKFNKMSNRIILPRMTGERVRLVFGVDTSGSMSDKDLKIGLGGIYEILNQYQDWELVLVTCDTGAKILGHYKSENGDTFDHIDKAFIGGGGTSMNPIVEVANDYFLDDGIDLCVIYTDGHIPAVTVPFLCETIFLITTDGAMVKDPRAKTIRVEV